jgi:hypothetical protein
VNLQHLFVTGIIAIAMLFPATASAAFDEAPPVELITIAATGDTFYENGTCVTAAGDAGLYSGGFDCITQEVYDEIFSYENLSVTPIRAASPDSELAGKSIAEVYNLQPDQPASERQLGVGLVKVPFTYGEVIARVTYIQSVGLPIRLA